MKTKVSSPGTKLLKLKSHILLSNLAFKCKLRRYTTAAAAADMTAAVAAKHALVRRCRLTLSNPR